MHGIPKIIISLCFFFVMFTNFGSWQQRFSLRPSSEVTVKNRWFHKGARWLGEIAVDALRLHRYLFTIDSVKILTGLTPFYLTARRFDEDFQCRFHDKTTHININQLPKQCHQVAQKGVGIPMVFLSGLSLYGWTEDLRMTGRIFAIGLPFVHSGKDIIKNLRTKSCLRPWHENFGKDKRSSGGFPSGHMANVVYMASLFGMRHGLKWAVPLGLFATFVFADFVNCNRHYLSQLIAGSGLGLLYGFAANTLIDKKLSERWSLNLCNNASGGPSVQLSYRF
jgi:hypothetical protein